MLDDTARHAGHADIVREQIDGRTEADHVGERDSDWWSKHLARVQQAADAFR